jgi:hypothetical protein
MPRWAVLAAAVILALHGLVHLMGAALYMKLANVQGLTYKTTLLGGRWDLGEAGIAVFGALWVIPAIGFLAGAAAFAAGWSWWYPVVATTTAFSLILTTLDWSQAFAGAIVDLAILAALVLSSLVYGLSA